MLFSCLDDEITRAKKGAQAGIFSWRGKAKVVWNNDRLRQLQKDLRGQQTALSTLINLLQV